MNTDIMSPDDATQLEWYFSEGKSTFARSLTGPMLSRAELYSAGTHPCYKCHDTCGVNPETGDWCKYCNGTGFRSFTIGWNKEVTARPTAEITEVRGYEPDHQTLMDYGKVARRLDKVALSVGSLGIKVLELYHGDEGAFWGRKGQSRLFALLPYTEGGKALLKYVREKDEEKEIKGIESVALTDSRKIEVQVELQKIQPDDKRRKYLESALSDAEKMYKRVAAAWMLTAQKNQSAPTGKDKSSEAKPKKKVSKRKNEVWTSGTIAPAKEKFKSIHELREIIGKEG